MQYINLLLDFIKEHYILTGAIITSLVQIAPIKINPLSWLGKLIQKAFHWIGKLMLAELLQRLGEIEKKFETKCNDLSDSVKIVQEENDRRRIIEIRWHIINFSDMLKHTEYEKDAYEHILDDLHPEYMELLDRYGLKNGKVDRAMELINESYEKQFTNWLDDN